MELSDTTMSFVRQLLTAGGAMLAGFGISGLDTVTVTHIVSDVAVILPAAVSLISIVWSVVSTYGKKKVPVGSTALELRTSVAVPPVGGFIDLTPMVGSAKVVG